MSIKLKIIQHGKQRCFPEFSRLNTKVIMHTERYGKDYKTDSKFVELNCSQAKKNVQKTSTDAM